MKKVKRVIALAIMSVMLMGTALTVHAAFDMDCHHSLPMKGRSVGMCTTGNGCGTYAYLYECFCGRNYAFCDRGHRN